MTAFSFSRSGKSWHGEMDALAAAVATSLAAVDTTALDRFFADRRSAYVATLPRTLGQAICATVTGTVYVGRAVCLQAGTYTQARFCTGSTAATGLTDARIGVWNAGTGAGPTAKLAESANFSGTFPAATTLATVSLGAGCTLAYGDVVHLGIGQIATTPATLRGLSGTTAMLNVVPAMSYSNSPWTTGVLPAAVASGANILPWIELLP